MGEKKESASAKKKRGGEPATTGPEAREKTLHEQEKREHPESEAAKAEDPSAVIKADPGDEHSKTLQEVVESEAGGDDTFANPNDPPAKARI